MQKTKRSKINQVKNQKMIEKIIGPLKTQADCDKLMENLKQKGYTWMDGDSPTKDNFWGEERAKTCFRIIGKKITGYCNEQWYLDGKHKIIPLEEYLGKETDFGIGDRIRIKAKPNHWASLLGGNPLGLDYPKEFVISEIKAKCDYVAIGTENGYGFALDSLVQEKIIDKIIPNRGMSPTEQEQRLRVGDRVKVVNGCDGAYGANDGIGIVTDKKSTNGLCGRGNLRVKMLDDGSIWELGKNPKIIKLTASGETISQKAKSMLRELTGKIKRIFKEDSRKQYQAGYINECGDLTGEGQSELDEIVRVFFNDKLTEKADERIVEEKEKEKENK